MGIHSSVRHAATDCSSLRETRSLLGGRSYLAQKRADSVDVRRSND